MLVVVVVVIVVVSVVDAMGERRAAVGVSVMRAAVMVALLGLVAAASSSGADVLADNLSSADQVEALVTIRAALRDPDNVLGGWVVTSGSDPCGWKGVTCSDGLIHTLELENMNLSGRLSPAIGKLRQLRNLFLDHNSISGPIPDTIGGLPLLQRLDLSGNQFNGTIPRTLGDLRDLYFVQQPERHVQEFRIKNVLKAVRAIFSELDEINAKDLIFPGSIQNTEEESEESQGATRRVGRAG
ncbi:hypothetical protein QYE76_009785 [Lolium multiflorum]|uniref:Leucine-rich repeat-containing N-terminal plant-type domain-containing protein n=1 Tax=Lolium multiflorum TaxID=4521 RepID=A0AAD8TVX6_LOLMU|nr:hypothetical protein QYE76_009785 [Lolium multiflorum]